MNFNPAVLAAAVLFAFGMGVPAQAEEARVEDVIFAPGTTGTTLTGTITGRNYVLYRIGAEGGQRMDVTLTSDNMSTYFNVYEPGRQPGDEALAVSEMTGPLVPDLNRFSGELPTSGEYTVSVYLYRNAARDGQTSNFSIDISINGETGEVVQGDFADGLQGGPDYWRVNAGGGLKMHRSPSTGAEVSMTLPNGLEVRNLGCRMAEGRRWCEVQTPEPPVAGWVAGESLVEAGGDVATQLPDMAPVDQGAPVQQSEADALVPGTNFNATGSVECYAAPGAETQMCDFGVIREGSGTGTVMVTLPDGMSRGIFYDSGVPVNFDRSEADGDLAFEAKKVADGYMVFIGEASVVLPDAVIYGG